MKNLILTGEISSPDVISTIILLDKDLSILSSDFYSLLKTNIFEYSYEIIKVVSDEIIDTLYYLKVNSDIFKCSPVSYNSKNIFSFVSDNHLINVSDKTWIQKSPILFKKGSNEVYSPIFVDNYNLDPYYSNVSLFLPMEGNNNSITFTDYSMTQKNITRNGDAKILTVQSKWGNGSGYFDGTGDYLSVPSLGGFGTGDFTVEFFNYSTKTSNSTIITFSTNNWNLYSGSGNLFFWNGGSNSIIVTSFPLNQWVHIALTRQSGVVKLWMDGVLKGSVTNMTNLTASTLFIGYYPPNSNYFEGYLQDLRITNSIARYTADFTPPSRIMYNNLTYSENLTQSVVLDNQLVTEWFNYSSGTISSSETLNIGSGILFSTVLKKKDSTPVNCSYLITEREYQIEIINDKFFLNDIQTELILSEQFQLFSFWISPSAFKTWLNNSLVEEEIDPYYSNVSLLLPLENNFIDYSPTPKNISVVGNTSISDTQSKWGVASGYFNGSGDYLTVQDTNDLKFGTGDFTVEAWIYITDSTLYNVICTKGLTTDGWFFSTYPSTRVLIFSANNTTIVTSSLSVSLNTWTHCAVSRNSSSLKLFLNGNFENVNTNSMDFSEIAELRIGRGRGNSANYFSGYLQDVSITKGVARYTANFTPPSKTFYYPKTLNFPDPYYSSVVLLLPMSGANNSATFTDYSLTPKAVTPYGGAKILTAQSKWGNGSGYFNGSVYYLTAPSSVTPALSEDFTIEMWAYALSLPASGEVRMFCHWLNATGVNFELRDNGQIGVYSFSPNGYMCGGSFQFNQWNHVAMTRQGNVFRAFVNGTLTCSMTNTTSFSSATFEVGYDSTVPSRAWFGYIQDLRITKGVARYTSNFTPPTKPFWYPSNNSISKQFVGYESNFGIFNTPEPSLDTITYLLESSNIKGTNKIIGQFYINDILMSGKDLILLDKNYYKLKTTITDINGDYSFNDLFYDSYYIASSEDNVQNIILGPIFPIPQ